MRWFPPLYYRNGADRSLAHLPVVPKIYRVAHARHLDLWLSTVSRGLQGVLLPPTVVMVEVILFRGWKDRERGVGTWFLGGWNSGVKMEWDIMDDNRDCIMCVELRCGLWKM